jgi:hypothetical protein
MRIDRFIERFYETHTLDDRLQVDVLWQGACDTLISINYGNGVLTRSRLHEDTLTVKADIEKQVLPYQKQGYKIKVSSNVVVPNF